MAAARQALNSVLGTVAKTANTITNTVDTIDTGVGMLNDFARNARRHQKLANAGREANFKSNLITTLAQEAAEIEYQAKVWASQNPELTALFEAQKTAIESAITEAEQSL
jgi:uncharacterized phage infection (PIP) family protein YhgE